MTPETEQEQPVPVQKKNPRLVLERIALTVWIIASFWTARQAFEIAELTAGTVQGSEFGMQITIARLLSQFIVWSVSYRAYVVARQWRLSKQV